ncbi:MAG: S16 family serine protease, partial [Caldilinea sp.]
VILPRRNDSDLEELPESVRKQMNFILVDTVDEVLAAALLSPEEAHATAIGLPIARSVAATNVRRRKQPIVKPEMVMRS